MTDAVKHLTHKPVGFGVFRCQIYAGKARHNSMSRSLRIAVENPDSLKIKLYRFYNVPVAGRQRSPAQQKAL